MTMMEKADLLERLEKDRQLAIDTELKSSLIRYGEIKKSEQILNSDLRELKQERTVITNRVQDTLRKYKCSDSVKIGNYRVEIESKFAGAIEPGKENEIIQWSNDNANDLTQLKVSVTGLKSLLNSGKSIPDGLNVTEFKQLKIKEG